MSQEWDDVMSEAYVASMIENGDLIVQVSFELEDNGQLLMLNIPHTIKQIDAVMHEISWPGKIWPGEELA